MDEKNMTGQKRMDKIDKETRDMERKHEEDKMSLIEGHREEMDRREQDQTEKKQADQDRYDELKQTKELDTQKYDTTMSQIYIDQEQLLENLARDQQLQKTELEAQKKLLSETINRMIKEHK